MGVPASEPPAAWKLLRFAVRALRISASTVAVVALLRQQWLAGALFAVAWLLILGAPLVIPKLEPESPGNAEGEPPSG